MTFNAKQEFVNAMLKKLVLMLFSIRLSNGWLLELMLTKSKYLLIIELMTFNAKTRVFL